VNKAPNASAALNTSCWKPAESTRTHQVDSLADRNLSIAVLEVRTVPYRRAKRRIDDALHS
jgi:hypothetical protein